jgi:hypothetical protein
MCTDKRFEDIMLMEGVGQKEERPGAGENPFA